MKRDSRLYLQDIIDSINSIYEYTKDMDLDAFKNDRKTQDAVVRNIEIIGEAAAQIPDNIKDLYPDIPWHKMKGMRNIIAHEYFGVRLTTIWETTQVDLPNIFPIIQKMISGLE